jgi:Uma2 family endonuclease
LGLGSASLIFTKQPDQPLKAVAFSLKLPETLDGLEEGKTLRIPASWDEYINLVEDTPYPIQFLNDEILIMGQPTDTHEQLVAQLIKLFAIYFDELDNCRVLGSNVKTVIPEQTGDFNADLSVVRGSSEYGTTPTGIDLKVRIKNSEIVVEVLSKSTRKLDLGEKFTAYQTVRSVQHIVFVDQQTVNISICSRTS